MALVFTSEAMKELVLVEFVPLAFINIKFVVVPLLNIGLSVRI